MVQQFLESRITDPFCAEHLNLRFGYMSILVRTADL